MNFSETYYVFRNAAGQVLKVLTHSLVIENPLLAAELSPVPINELNLYSVGSKPPVPFNTYEKAIICYPAKDNAVQTVFGVTNGTWWVEKRATPNICTRSRAGFSQRAIPRTPLIKGQKVFHDKMLITDKEIDIFFAKLFKVFPLNNGILAPEAVDALPRNCLINEFEEAQFFDLEYIHSGGIRASFVIYRALKMDILPRQNKSKTALKAAYDKWCKKFGLKNVFAEDQKLSKEFKLLFSGNPHRRIYAFLLSLIPSRSFRESKAWWSDKPVIYKSTYNKI